MHVAAIVLVLLVGGTWAILATVGPLSARRTRGWRRWVSVPAQGFLVVGGLGFFGCALSAVGGLNWLPHSFEWPAGYCKGVVSTPGGLRVVPHTASGRVQVYDSDWRFVRGWHVYAGGGVFKIVEASDVRIEVVTARGDWHYVFGIDGEQLSKQEYTPKQYSSFPDKGAPAVVPTAPWLWVFSSPFISWGVMMLGIGGLVLLNRSRLKRRPARKPNAATK